jgi:pimeloyl-ACP methyl ester carboxylesterase
MSMEQVRSSDGTRIVFERSGTGPALVVVVGAFCDRTSKKSLSAGLASRFTVYEYDRRGRGDSEDAEGWSIQKEVDDLAAVISAAGGSAGVFGDSSGGAIALEAAATTPAVRAVAVYEVPYVPAPSDEFADQLDAHVAAGDADEATASFLQLMGTPAAAIAQMREAPFWPHMAAAAPSLSREVRLCNSGQLPREHLSRITVPTLALAGSASPAPMANAAADIAAAVRGGMSRLLEGQRHAVDDDVLRPVLEQFFEPLIHETTERASTRTSPTHR